MMVLNLSKKKRNRKEGRSVTNRVCVCVDMRRVALMHCQPVRRCAESSSSSSSSPKAVWFFKIKNLHTHTHRDRDRDKKKPCTVLERERERERNSHPTKGRGREDYLLFYLGARDQMRFSNRKSFFARYKQSSSSSSSSKAR